MNKILAITPTYNEILNIENLINSIISLDMNIDILVVDDASPDGTANYVKSHPMYNQKIFLMSRPEKLGLGSAYCSGFEWALNKQYSKVIQIDADLSHNPKYIPLIIKESDNYDLIIGSRYVDGVNVVNWPMSRLLLSYFANLYCRLILGINIKDFTGGFKCFNREVLEHINLKDVKSEGYSFQVEMNLKVHSKNFTIKEVPIIFNDRTSGSSKMSKKVIFEAVYMVPLLRIRKLFKIL